MILRLHHGAMLFALFLAACAQGNGVHTANSSHDTDAVKKARLLPPITCAGFIDEGSDLDLDIKSMKSGPVCKREFHPGGQGYYEAFGTGGIVERQGVPGAGTIDASLTVLVFRFYGDADAPGPIEGSELRHARNFRHLDERVPVTLAGATGPAIVSRYEIDDSGVTNVCLDANTRNADGSGTVVNVCRTGGKQATDAAVITLATSIATHDFATINP